ncbi:MAG: AAC(3) family N-acetyltransferase [Candidatus Lokiarchaeota archaeon]|nr:AAC(3) family N-acetyltransferase [Candidatus Lokiarchaeota archaeon]
MKAKKSEGEIVKKTKTPNTITSLKHDFKTLGITTGSVVIMHSSLSEIGWTVGGPVSVIQALLEILTTNGTLIMPTFSSDNSDPTYWENPPVPEEWWDIIKTQMPAYQPEITPTREMGRITDTFRNWPNVLRSAHPSLSFAAWGKYAKKVTANHKLTSGLGEDSPLARIYDLDGKILLLGVNHYNNTSLHLAEYRSEFPGKNYVKSGSAMIIKNKRSWVEYEDLDHNSDDFEQLGIDYESEINYIPGKIGIGETRLISQRKIVDFAKEWFPKNR